jgi:RNA 2',3'-cyclic 3'-phosphodiesterase
VGEAATVERDEKIRLFLALTLPDGTSRELARWATDSLSGGRVLEHFHVTLAFLGGRPRSELDAILGALREASADARPFTLVPTRYRETRSVGMLVLDDPTGAARSLAEELQGRLEGLGCYRREKRPWLPHVTVLRFRERPRLAPPLPEVEPFAPSGAAAFLSRLHPSGARYEIVEICPFRRAPVRRRNV